MNRNSFDGLLERIFQSYVQQSHENREYENAAGITKEEA